MKVKLTYFTNTGKYYSMGECDIDKENLYEIWEELEVMFYNGKRPGLIDGHSDFSVLVDVPDHPYNHPHLMLNKA